LERSAESAAEVSAKRTLSALASSILALGKGIVPHTSTYNSEVDLPPGTVVDVRFGCDFRSHRNGNGFRTNSIASNRFFSSVCRALVRRPRHRTWRASLTCPSSLRHTRSSAKLVNSFSMNMLGNTRSLQVNVNLGWESARATRNV